MKRTKSKTAARTRGRTNRGSPKIESRDNVVTSENDNLSKAIRDIVPPEFRGTDKFLDVVQWNLEWFGASKSRARDQVRAGLVLEILKALNADLFVFQEVVGPTQDGRQVGALDSIADALTNGGAGDYFVSYTEAGGEQRVAMMWDRDWLRSKVDVKDLFPLGTYQPPDGKDPFARRTPLHGHFEVRIPTQTDVAGRPGGSGVDFDFQILGVHLKAMPEGYEQRLASAKILADWMTREAPRNDADIMIVGDWNAPPNDRSWVPFHELEKKPQSNLFFSRINDPSDFSYLWLANRSEKYVSRIDLTAMSASSMHEVVGKPAQVVLWKPIAETIARAADITKKEVASVMKRLKEEVSDHLPTVSRFYFK